MQCAGSSEGVAWTLPGDLGIKLQPSILVALVMPLSISNKGSIYSKGPYKAVVDRTAIPSHEVTL